MKDSKEWFDCAVLLKRSTRTLTMKPAKSFPQDKCLHHAANLIAGPEQRSYVTEQQIMTLYFIQDYFIK
jgi:hypothetical protein